MLQKTSSPTMMDKFVIALGESIGGKSEFQTWINHDYTLHQLTGDFKPQNLSRVKCLKHF